MKANLSLMTLEEAFRSVRTFSGQYPVCIVTSPQGSSIIRPILEGCGYRLMLQEVKLIENTLCKPDTIYFLNESDYNKFIKANGIDA